MKDYNDERAVADFIWSYFSHLFTEVERKAHWAVLADGKEAIGSKGVAELIRKRRGLDDPHVMAELTDGSDAFSLRSANRVLREHAEEITVNRCPQCKRVVRTPKAQQCFWCRFDWHPSN